MNGRWWRLLPLAAVVLIGAALDPRLVLTSTTPSGPDLGAHIYPFSVGVRSLLESARLLGWDDGWFAGFPIFYFYFPLPAFVAALVTPALGFEVALKLATVSGPLLLPVASWVLARRIGLSRLEAGLASVVGSSFLFMESYWHLGGNLYSTLLGEFAFGLSFPLSILFVGLITPAVNDGAREHARAAVVLALTALAHVLTTFAAVVASAPNLLRTETRRGTVLVWGLAFFLTGAWAVPFLIRAPHMGHLPWIPSRSLLTLLPLELWFVLLPGVAGIVMLARRGRSAWPVLTLLAASVTLFLLPTGLEMRDRLLPYWYFGVHFAAGVALGHWVRGFIERRSGRPLVAATATAALVLTVFTVRGPGSVIEFARTNLSGYERHDGWPQYRAFLDSVARLPPGRVLSQGDTVLIGWGSAHAATALPYWDPGHASLTGFWGESSPTSVFALRAAAALSPARIELTFRASPDTPYAPRVGVAQAAFLGARYFAAFTEDGAAGASVEAGLEAAAHGDGFTIFEIDGRPLVSPARYIPVVLEGSDFSEAAHAWFGRHERLDEWLTADGPSEWPRRSGDPATWPRPDPLSESPDVRIVADEGDRITFRTDAVGVPHLVRVSHFPNWRVLGADGPYLAAPYFMVVVPRETEVTLAFGDTWVEWLGRTLSMLGVVGLAVVAVRSRTTPVGTVGTDP